jgi:hypothetical protein
LNVYAHAVPGGGRFAAEALSHGLEIEIRSRMRDRAARNLGATADPSELRHGSVTRARGATFE